jgi:peroxiredoxin
MRDDRDDRKARGRERAAEVLAGVAVLAALAVAASCRVEARGVEVGHKAPAYSTSNLAGEEVSLDDYLGQVVLVNIWATWCGPCRVEMPSIQALYDHYKDRGFTVLAVSIDAGPGYTEKVREFVAELELTFPILLDPDGRITKAFQTIGVPETFVLDREGRIVKRVIGATDWDSPANQALIEELLGM